MISLIPPLALLWSCRHPDLLHVRWCHPDWTMGVALTASFFILVGTAVVVLVVVDKPAVERSNAAQVYQRHWEQRWPME